jgi:hypothetical protein
MKTNVSREEQATFKKQGKKRRGLVETRGSKRKKIQIQGCWKKVSTSAEVIEMLNSLFQDAVKIIGWRIN